MATPGRTLGPYQLISSVGAGGMGEVWRAHDPRLGREVAIKILPATFSSDPDRLRRFEQEARSAASLNHPNIVAVFDIGTQNGAPYIVTELLHGESLREKLRSGALPLRKLMEIAAQIARGLAAAHERGIVHRDLKPENVFLARDGQVKLLDFGLAKLMEKSTANGTSLPTMTEGTSPGLVLGTVGYMSPEQVRGRNLDHRSDIFSFGAVVYEMASGRRAFHGETTADTLSAILKDEPPEISATGHAVPPAVERIVRHCLEKDPEQRFQSARDIAFDLEAISLESSGASSAAATATAASDAHARRRRLTFATVGTVGLLAVAIAAYVAGRGFRPARAATLRRVTFRNGQILSARFAPDGHSLYYSASWAANPEELYSVSENAPAARSVGLRNTDILAVTRAGELLVLTDITDVAGNRVTLTGTLSRVPVSGGAPKPLLERIGAADVSPDGTALAVSRVSMTSPAQLEYPVGTVLYRAPGFIDSVRISPDGERVAFLDHPGVGDDRGAVAMVDRKGTYTKLTTELNSVSGVAWAPSGELWFSNAGTVQAVKPGEKPRVIFEAPTSKLSLHDVDAEGHALLTSGSYRYGMVALAPGAARETDISWLDWPVVRGMSADGKRVLFVEQGSGQYSVYLGYTDGTPPALLGEGDAQRLSPDGKWAAATTLSASPQVLLYPTGAGEPRQVTHDNIDYRDCGWHPDGAHLYCFGNEPGHGVRTYAIDIATGKSVPVTPEGMIGTEVSPDGRYLDLFNPRRIWKLDGSGAIEIRGLGANEIALTFAANGDLFVARLEGTTAHIMTLNPFTGQRKPVRDFSSPAVAGYKADLPFMTPDGRGYAYRYRLRFDDLYLVSNLH